MTPEEERAGIRAICEERGITLEKARQWSADAEEKLDDVVWLRWRMTMARLPLDDDDLRIAVSDADWSLAIVKALKRGEQVAKTGP